MVAVLRMPIASIGRRKVEFVSDQGLALDVDERLSPQSPTCFCFVIVIDRASNIGRPPDLGFDELECHGGNVFKAGKVLDLESTLDWQAHDNGLLLSRMGILPYVPCEPISRLFGC